MDTILSRVSDFSDSEAVQGSEVQFAGEISSEVSDGGMEDNVMEGRVNFLPIS